MDPRAKYTMEDRKAQYDQAIKLYKSMAKMSFAVDSMVGLRDGAASRAGKLPANDPLRKSLEHVSQQADALRSKIVATKEGGAITGEERIREFLTGIYGDITNYEGRPTDSHVARADALSRELDDVVKQLDQLTSTELPRVNEGLRKKKLEPIQLLTQAQWEKMHEGEGGSSAGESMHGRREID
jgi:hypothetical protein